jgi:hypothetical protein
MTDAFSWIAVGLVVALWFLAPKSTGDGSTMIVRAGRVAYYAALVLSLGALALGEVWMRGNQRDTAPIAATAAAAIWGIGRGLRYVLARE